MRQNRRIAVTGGIGSGKSELLRAIETLHFPVFSCDDISHELWGEEEYRKALAEMFPECTNNNVIDKKKLSALVFSDELARKKLEAFSHPVILSRLFERADEVPLAFCEVPLLFEGGYEEEFDGAIVVVRNEEERVRAVALRDGITKEEVRARMRAQTKEYRGNLVVVENDGTLSDLQQKAREAVNFFL